MVQTVYKYVQKSGDVEFLEEEIQGETVAERLNKAMEFLLNHRYDQEYGLLWGATTADWGDVQPEHEWGVYIDENTHYAIDIYDNAMFLIALDHLMELLPDSRSKWIDVREEIASRCQEHLWDESLQKFTRIFIWTDRRFLKTFKRMKYIIMVEQLSQLKPDYFPKIRSVRRSHE